MKSQLTKIFGMGLIAAASMLAQTSQPTPARQAPSVPGAHRRAGMMHRMAVLLNLTPDQKTQAKAIFQAAHTSAQPLGAQMRQARLALADAVKANAPEADIDRLASNAGAVASQLTAVRAKALEKFYTILTPDQRDKLNGSMGQFLKG